MTLELGTPFIEIMFKQKYVTSKFVFLGPLKKEFGITIGIPSLFLRFSESVFKITVFVLCINTIFMCLQKLLSHLVLVIYTLVLHSSDTGLKLVLSK